MPVMGCRVCGRPTNGTRPYCSTSCWNIELTGEEKPCKCGCDLPVLRRNRESDKIWERHAFANRKCKDRWERGKDKKEKKPKPKPKGGSGTLKEHDYLENPPPGATEALLARRMRGALI
jgi:hypothetical protein